MQFDELATAVQHYQMALAGLNVTVQAAPGTLTGAAEDAPDAMY